MKIVKKIATLLTLAVCTSQASATLLHDQDLVNGVFFGTGNSNGGFTVDTQNNIEIGLRGKLRFDTDNQPKSIYNSNGDGTFSFDAIAPPTGFGWAPGSTSSAIWNVDWSIDVSGTAASLDTFVYLFEIDFDPSAGTNFLTFDPINSPNDNDVQNNTAQNSWNMEFFDGPGFPFLNTANGIFDVRLSALSANGELLAQSSIQILQGTVPVSAPSTALLFTLALGGIWLRQRNKQA